MESMSYKHTKNLSKRERLVKDIAKWTGIIQDDPAGNIRDFVKFLLTLLKTFFHDRKTINDATFYPHFFIIKNFESNFFNSKS
ncbi:hypothetical protein BpHYR1_016731 [Brachionus plicatilis]|uniref:Uncharacterized protein n=1 Tax=Brachionus plicatilis TaxID=10195 RepID=A0A3M7QKJ7_BRAPC|nr:hypothetical protein BpHYR1_016731 [Brachionus plicatilis]